MTWTNRVDKTRKAIQEQTRAKDPGTVEIEANHLLIILRLITNAVRKRRECFGKLDTRTVLDALQCFDSSCLKDEQQKSDWEFYYFLLLKELTQVTPVRNYLLSDADIVQQVLAKFRQTYQAVHNFCVELQEDPDLARLQKCGLLLPGTDLSKHIEKALPTEVKGLLEQQLRLKYYVLDQPFSVVPGEQTNILPHIGTKVVADLLKDMPATESSHEQDKTLLLFNYLNNILQQLTDFGIHRKLAFLKTLLMLLSNFMTERHHLNCHRCLYSAEMIQVLIDLKANFYCRDLQFLAFSTLSTIPTDCSFQLNSVVEKKVTSTTVLRLILETLEHDFQIHPDYKHRVRSAKQGSADLDQSIVLE